MKQILSIIVLLASLFLCAACSSDDDAKKNKMPRRSGSTELPWDRPANWEGGLPGMGGIGNTPRF